MDNTVELLFEIKSELKFLEDQDWYNWCLNEPKDSNPYIELKKQRDYYEKIAGAYAIIYENDLKDEHDLILADGALLEMYSDIYRHEKKSGESEKSKAQKSRLIIIKKTLESLRRYVSKNNQMKLMLTDQMNRNADLVKENDQLRKENESMKKSYNELE